MSQALLEIEGLSKRFGGLQALDGLSLAADAGQILGIVGPNGAGKTALINCVSGFYRPEAGSIRLGGMEIARLPMHRIGRLGVARTFQNIRLFRRMSVLENVLAAQAAWRARPFASLLHPGPARYLQPALELLERLRLRNRADDPAGVLAYGEARRLEIARALAAAPRLLFLDEPAAGMNEAETAALIEDIRSIRDLVEAVVIVEHDIELIRTLSDRIVAMDYGRKIAEGSAAEVFANPQVLSAYLGSDD